MFSISQAILSIFAACVKGTINVHAFDLVDAIEKRREEFAVEQSGGAGVEDDDSQNVVPVDAAVVATDNDDPSGELHTTQKPVGLLRMCSLYALAKYSVMAVAELTETGLIR